MKITTNTALAEIASYIASNGTAAYGKQMAAATYLGKKVAVFSGKDGKISIERAFRGSYAPVLTASYDGADYFCQWMGPRIIVETVAQVEIEQRMALDALGA